MFTEQNGHDINYLVDQLSSGINQFYRHYEALDVTEWTVFDIEQQKVYLNHLQLHLSLLQSAVETMYTNAYQSLMPLPYRYVSIFILAWCGHQYNSYDKFFGSQFFF